MDNTQLEAKILSGQVLDEGEFQILLESLRLAAGSQSKKDRKEATKKLRTLAQQALRLADAIEEG